MSVKEQQELEQLVVVNDQLKAITTRNSDTFMVKRKTDLAAPNMLYTGHEGPVTSVVFSPSGSYFASSSLDRTVRIWDLKGDCRTVLGIHKKGLMGVCWIDEERVAACALDGSITIWDVFNGEKLGKLDRAGHNDICNGVSVVSSRMLASVGNDGQVLLWEGGGGMAEEGGRRRVPIGKVATKLPITCVVACKESNVLFHAGIDGNVTARDIRQLEEPLYILSGHTDSIVGLGLDPIGTQLLSASLDNTISQWLLPERQLINKFYGAKLGGIEKNLYRPAFNHDSSHIACGSADRTAIIWSVGKSQSICYKLPGHTGAVTWVDWHPTQDILASASTDCQIYLGDLDLEACESI